MANYTTNLELATRFTPYRQQLPVEEMVGIANQKQAMYNEGIQKIQDSIDKVAGLPVVREVDKQYLQSKLNSLGTKLKTFVGADYSNFQLTNNVMGMTKEIADDPNVVNAVSSTQKYKNELDLMDADRKNGKSNPANSYDFYVRANRWLTSTDPSDSFNDKYQPPIDYKKKWTEALGKLHTNLTSQDIMNAMDSKGNIDPTKLSAAMTRTKTEGISVSQIQNAINSVIGPEDLNQMAIEGRYTFKDASIDSIQNHYRNEASSNIMQIDKQLEALQAFAKANSADAESYNKAMSSINTLTERKKQIQESLPSTLKRIQENPDEAKYEIYKQGVVDSFANSFAWENKVVEHMTNPALTAQHWEKEHALDQAKFNLSKDEFTWKKYQDDRNYELNKLESEFKRGVGVGGGTGEFTVYKGTSTVVDPPMKAYEKGIVEKEANANKILQDFASSTGNSIGVAEEIYSDYLKGDMSKVPSEWRKSFADIYQNRQDAKIDKDILEKTKERAAKDPSIQKEYNSIMNNLSSLSDLNINLNGKVVKFSQKEIFDFLNKERDVFTPQSEFYAGAPKETKEIDRETLNQKEKLLYDSLVGSRYRGIPTQLSSMGNTVERIFSSYKNVLKQSQKINDSLNSKTEELLRPTLSKYLPTETTITVDGKTPTIAREKMENLVMSVSDSYTEDEQPLMKQSDMKKVQEWIGDKKVKEGLQYKRLEQAGKEWILVKNGTEEITVPLTPVVATQLPKTGLTVTDEQQRIEKRYDAYNYQTNPDNKEDMFVYTQRDFPYVKNYRMAADLSGERKDANLHHIKLKINVPGLGWKTISINDSPMSLPNVKAWIGSLTDRDVQKLGIEWGDSETRQFFQQVNK